jgi:hypothetical protein
MADSVKAVDPTPSSHDRIVPGMPASTYRQ